MGISGLNRAHHNKVHHSIMEKKNLFVEEEEEYSESPATDQYQEACESPQLAEEDDDPVILTIPIVHGSIPERQAQSLHILQYTGRPKNRHFEGDLLKASIKPSSKVVEVDVPMDTSKFYGESRAEELGLRVETSALQGVLADSDGGLYVGQVVEKDGDLQVVLLPVDSTAQLRPQFKYLDDLESSRGGKQESAPQDNSKSGPVQVLQTASKSSSQLNSEAHGAGTMGSCLKHFKHFNEELWGTLSWRNTDDSSAAELISKLRDPAREHVATTTTFDEFS